MPVLESRLKNRRAGLGSLVQQLDNANKRQVLMVERLHRRALGAFQQNTLESTANNLRATLENTVNAESVIRDTDFAEEIANFTRNQVLVQAGTSVLSSANQTPQLVLSLLG